MRESAQVLHRMVRLSQSAVHEAVIRLMEEAKDCTDIDELADYAYAVKKTAEYADEVTKDLNKLADLVDTMTGVKWTVMAAVTGGEPIRTDYCTASPNPKPIFTLPTRKKDPEKYLELMDYLGVPHHLLSLDDMEAKEAVKIHWPGLMDYLSRQMAAGQPLPPGIDPDKCYTKFSLNIRSKKGVEE